MTFILILFSIVATLFLFTPLTQNGRGDCVPEASNKRAAVTLSTQYRSIINIIKHNAMHRLSLHASLPTQYSDSNVLFQLEISNYRHSVVVDGIFICGAIYSSFWRLKTCYQRPAATSEECARDEEGRSSGKWSWCWEEMSFPVSLTTTN